MNSSAIILGLGPSLHNWKREKGQFAIGCNNIWDYRQDVDAICIVDEFRRMQLVRPTTFNTPLHIPRYVRDKKWIEPNAVVHKIPASKHKSMIGKPRFVYKEPPINYGYTCPFYATVLAMHLGYKHITIYGVDLTGDHQLNNKRSQDITVREFQELIKFAEKEEIKIMFHESSALYGRVHNI